MQYEVPVGKHNDRQHASLHHEVATDVKQMPIRPIIYLFIYKNIAHGADQISVVLDWFDAKQN